MERMNIARAEQWSPEDIEADLAHEPELLKYIQLLPKELWKRHFNALEKIDRDYVNDNEANIRERKIGYVLNVLNAREQAIVEYDIGEQRLKDVVSNTLGGNEVFGTTLHEALIAPGNFLGAGATARVKAVHLEGFDEPVAVKYLLTPTTKTLSAQGEYDMLREVETLKQIEHNEVTLGGGANIRVPHPYFFYKRGKFQCYGMSEVKGSTLEEILDEEKNDPARHYLLGAVRKRFPDETSKALLRQEVDTFMQAVHEACLHGDIRMANVMLDEEGVLYLIDFGQSNSIRNLTEETREQFENLQELEIGQMRECVRQLLKAL